VGEEDEKRTSAMKANLEQSFRKSTGDAADEPVSDSLPMCGKCKPVFAAYSNTCGLLLAQGYLKKVPICYNINLY